MSEQGPKSPSLIDHSVLKTLASADPPTTPIPSTFACKSLTKSALVWRAAPFDLRPAALPAGPERPALFCGDSNPGKRPAHWQGPAGRLFDLRIESWGAPDHVRNGLDSYRFCELIRDFSRHIILGPTGERRTEQGDLMSKKRI